MENGVRQTNINIGECEAMSCDIENKFTSKCCGAVAYEDVPITCPFSGSKTFMANI